MDIDPIYQSVAARDAAFCRLIQLIPKEVYYHTNTAEGMAPYDDEEETVSRSCRIINYLTIMSDHVDLSFRYYKHKKAPLAADEKKSRRKQRRDATYGLGDAGDEGDKEEVADADVVQKMSSDLDYDLDNVEGIEALKRRLKDKIDAMQSGRNAVKGEKRERPSKERKSQGVGKIDDSESASSNDEEGEEDSGAEMSDGDEYMYSDMEEADDVASDNHSSDAEGLVDDVGDIDFSGIVTSQRAALDEPVRNKPGSKMKRLKKLVEESKKKRQRIDELKAQGSSGKDRAVAEAWSDVLKEAAGEKVLSNTKRLQKAIKTREKKKEKSAATWQARVENVAADKTDRIQKREENINQKKKGIAPPPPATDGTATAEAPKPTRKDRAKFAKQISKKRDGKDSDRKGNGGRKSSGSDMKSKKSSFGGGKKG